MLRTALCFVALVFLQSCTSLHVMSHVPLSTMSRLSSLKLSEIEPSDLRVAARLPESLEPRRHGVKVRISMTASRQAAEAFEEFILAAANEPRELAGLSAHQRKGARIWVYRLSDADIDRLRRIIALSGGPAAELGVSIAAGVDACRRAPLGSAPLPTTTFLRTNVAGFFVLTEDLDLRTVLPESELATKVPPCG